MISIYHNPRCSKSRETLQLLVENGVEPTIIEYLKVGVTSEEVHQLLIKLDIKPRELMRLKEIEYKEQGLNDVNLSAQELVDAIVTAPKLLERPIVVNGNKAAIGRPPQAILDIL